jgi:hypothetical protein
MPDAQRATPGPYFTTMGAYIEFKEGALAALRELAKTLREEGPWWSEEDEHGDS